MNDRISVKEFRESDGVADWRVLGDGAYAFFRADSFAESVSLVDAIVPIAATARRSPDIDIRAGGVTVRLVTEEADYFGMSRGDAELAARISTAARDLGFASDPMRVQSLLIVPGAPSVPAVIPFWRAVLGYEPRNDSPDEDLVDPQLRNAPFWFERMDRPRPDGGGAIHVGVFVPYEEAEARVAAALAAGGRMVRDEFAPMWWTLADAAGNEADIATTMGRD